MIEPTILFSDANVQVWHGDAELALDLLPFDIDLLLADPPFGPKYQSNWGSGGEAIVGDADQDKINRILSGCWKKIRPHRHAYIFGPPRDLHAARSQLIWDRVYMSGGDLSDCWGSAHVPIWFYRHNYPSRPRDGELAARLRRGTVIREPGPRGSVRTQHPNHKPVRLWQRLIESSSLVGDLVVDPSCGGGSSAVASIISGRRYIGIEIDLTYATRAAEWAARTARLIREVGR